MTSPTKPLFVFGTLMDADVLEEVSGQPITSLVCQPAVVADHQRRLVMGESFPVLVPASGESVLGLLVRGLTETALQRAQFFEGDEYSLQPISVTTLPDSHAPYLASGDCEAGFFADNQVYEVEQADWSVQQWQQDCKADFMPRLKHYMSYFGTLSATDADQHW